MRISLLLASVITMTGCYDLSAPSGPTRDDFARNSAVAPTDPAAEDDTCTGDDCPAESALTTRSRPPRADLDDDVVVVNDAAQQGLQGPRK